MGVKGVYIDAIHPDWGKSLAQLGLDDQQIADRMGVSRKTINKWKKDHPVFGDSLKNGKEPTDAKVEQALLKRALGYQYDEEKVVIETDADGNKRPARIERIKKHVTSDTTACIFWLKNRRPDLWRDVHRVDGTVKHEDDVKQYEEMLAENENLLRSLEGAVIADIIAAKDGGKKAEL